ncbi:hypothetical protein JCM11491_001381 [Sporobolomyces phaffii]
MATMDPNAFVRLLYAFAANPTAPDDLVQLVRPARILLRDAPHSRADLGRADGFWVALGSVWQSQASLLERDDKASIPAIQALAAFLIGLTTMDPDSQREAIANVEPHLRSILHTSSSLFNLEDPMYQPMIRTCCQALANLVTSNPAASAVYFPQRLRAEESDQLLQRLLATPDDATLQAILIFLLNSIHSSPERALLLGTSKAGAAILDRIMVLVSSVYDNDSQENPAPMSEEGSDLFGLSFAIVKQIIETGMFAETYAAHKLLPGFSISPTLIILLKYLDGFLSSHLASTPSTSAISISRSLLPFLHRQLVSLSTSLLERNERERSDALGFQGVVLILHCLCEIGLGIDRDEQRKMEQGDEDSEPVTEAERGPEGLGDSIELVVRLLHFSSTSIAPPSARPQPNSSARISEIDPANPASVPPPPSAAEEADQGDDVVSTSAGFQQLKLICVKYLGIVSFQPPRPAAALRKGVPGVNRVEAYQNVIRESGGLGLLLGMCQIDGRNPTLREHALLAIRNILKDNVDNQDYIDKMKPQFKVGDDGSLQDLPPALRPEQ